MGRSYLLNADWLVIYPGLIIAALVIGFNLLGRLAGPPGRARA